MANYILANAVTIDWRQLLELVPWLVAGAIVGLLVRYAIIAWRVNPHE